MVPRLRLYTQIVRYAIAGAMGMLVGAAVLSSNVNERYGFGISTWGTMFWSTSFGWPLVYCHQSVSEPKSPPPRPPFDQRRVLSRSFSWSRVSVNAVAGLWLVVSTMLAILFATRRGVRRTFSLLTLLAGVTIASLLMALLRYERSYDVLLALVGTYYPASLLPWWICISLFFGMACALYVTGWLLAAAAGRIVGRRATS